MKKILAITIFLLSLQYSFAAVRTAVKNNGDWSTSATWLEGVVPTYGDSIIIPSTILVNFDLSRNKSYPNNNLAPLHILVEGTLFFPAGKKLALPCGSMVYIVGWVRAENTTGGANNQSNIIDICDQTLWYSGMRDITGTTLHYDSPLPINLLSFDAKCNGKVNISWSTSTETNNSYFTLERSTDARNWYNIATIPGAGNSNTILNYQYTDENSVEGISYYRLTQTDYDGKFETFSPVAVVCGSVETTEINVYPNPFKSDLIIKYSNLTEGNAIVKVYDMRGNIVVNKSIDVATGSNDYILNLQSLAEGLYDVEFFSGNTRYHQKMLKN